MEKKILACVGHSGVSADVLKCAGRLAQERDGELTILHVRPEGRLVYEAKDIFREFLKKQKIDVPHKVLNPIGSPHVLIADAMQKMSFDLVVMGSHSHNLVGRLFMGQVARYVLHHAKCPVYLYKRHKKLLAPKILVPVDFTEVNLKLAGIADEWARLNHSELAFIHVDRVVERDYAWGAHLYGDSEEMATEKKKKAEALRKKMRAFLEKAGVSSVYTTHVAEGHPGTEVLAYQEEIRAELIMAAAHSHTIIDRVLIGGTTDYLLNHGKCPLYVYRDKMWHD